MWTSEGGAGEKGAGGGKGGKDADLYFHVMVASS